MTALELIGFFGSSLNTRFSPYSKMVGDSDQVRWEKTNSRVEAFWNCNPFSNRVESKLLTGEMRDQQNGLIYGSSFSQFGFVDRYGDSLPNAPGDTIRTFSLIDPPVSSNLFTLHSYDDLPKLKTQYITSSKLFSYRLRPMIRSLQIQSVNVGSSNYNFQLYKDIDSTVYAKSIFALRGVLYGDPVLGGVSIPTFVFKSPATGGLTIGMPTLSYPFVEGNKDFLISLSRETGRAAVPVMSGEQLMESFVSLIHDGNTRTMSIFLYEILNYS